MQIKNGIVKGILRVIGSLIVDTMEVTNLKVTNINGVPFNQLLSIEEDEPPINDEIPSYMNEGPSIDDEPSILNDNQIINNEDN